jgi:phosphopantothenoylcysteine decarboxylase/phosphopantothenate--cysteine ligase
MEPPAAVDVVRVRSAADMHRAVLARAERADVVIMAAAVADYTPAERVPAKITKEADSLTLVLTRTPDILGDLGTRRLANGTGPILVGFAAETGDVVVRATAKREAKHVDLIVANDISRDDAGFDVDTNLVTIIGADGAEALPLQPKARVALEILDRVERLLAGRSSVTSGVPVGRPSD